MGGGEEGRRGGCKGGKRDNEGTRWRKMENGEKEGERVKQKKEGVKEGVPTEKEKEGGTTKGTKVTERIIIEEEELE